MAGDPALDAARADAPEHVAMIERMKTQLLIVFLKRLGGDIRVPVAEIDNTGGDLFSFNVDPATREFHFVVSKKS
jgi:hypothetical protein